MISGILKFSKSKKNIKYNLKEIENFSMVKNSKKLFKYFDYKNEF